MRHALQNDQLYPITIALAGMTQAIALVQEFAQTGELQPSAYTASVHSLFQTHPRDILEVYDGVKGIKLGLEKMIHSYELNPQATRMQTRYLISLIHLQKKIFLSQPLVALLNQRLLQTQKQISYFSITHPTVIANLADTYQLLVNRLKFKIMIWGNQRILSVHDNMNKIRTLLFAGVRATTLWRQMGGSRLQLLFHRQSIKQMAEKILQENKETV